MDNYMQEKSMNLTHYKNAHILHYWEIKKRKQAQSLAIVNDF